MKSAQTVTLLIATVCAGLMAGLFAAFAYSVMPGLARSSDRTLIEAMQNINKAILNPAFMIPFLLTIPLLIAAIVLAWRGAGRDALPWIIAALVLYLVAFFVTSGVNVPLNDQLEKAGNPAHIQHLAAVRGSFEPKWVAWNIVRALLHLAAFACLTWALVSFGGNRGGTHPMPAQHAAYQSASPASTQLSQPDSTVRT